MSVLGDLREQAAATLTAAGYPATAYTAERLTPPCTVVVPGDPYVRGPDGEGSTPFGHMDVALQVLLVAGKSTNLAAADWIDQAITDALAALLDADWDVTEASQPQSVQINGQDYLGAVLSIEQTVRLG